MSNSPKMNLAVSLASAPISRMDLANQVGPSQKFGYATVNRAIKAGLLVAAETPTGRRGLFVVAKVTS